MCNKICLIIRLSNLNKGLESALICSFFFFLIRLLVVLTLTAFFVIGSLSFFILLSLLNLCCFRLVWLFHLVCAFFATQHLLSSWHVSLLYCSVLLLIWHAFYLWYDIKACSSSLLSLKLEVHIYAFLSLLFFAFDVIVISHFIIGFIITMSS